MRRFFSFITCIVITAGCSVSDNLKEGDNFSLIVRIPELKTVNRVTVRQRNGTQEVFRHCSLEEQNRGCKQFNSARFSLQIGNETFCVTFIDASTRDEGVYEVEVIDDESIRICRNFTVALTGSLETPWTISLELINIIAGAFAVIASVIYLSPLLIIYCICEKKQQYTANADDGAEDPEEIISLSSAPSGASKPATDESFEVVDETKCSVANNNQRSKKDLNHGA